MGQVTEARISVMGSADDFSSLEDWLQQERALRGRLTRTLAPHKADEMGSNPELLVALLSSGFAVTLARSIHVWLTQRHSDIKLTVTAADGRSVDLSIQRLSDVEPLLTHLFQTVDIDALTKQAEAAQDSE